LVDSSARTGEVANIAAMAAAPWKKCRLSIDCPNSGIPLILPGARLLIETAAGNGEDTSSRAKPETRGDRSVMVAWRPGDVLGLSPDAFKAD
jgi:hypothetical protein